MEGTEVAFAPKPMAVNTNFSVFGERGNFEWAMIRRAFCSTAMAHYAPAIVTFVKVVANYGGLFNLPFRFLFESSRFIDWGPRFLAPFYLDT